MSDTLNDDRDALAATLVPYTDVAPPLRNDGVMMGGLLSLWPTLGAQALGLLQDQPPDVSAIASTSTPSSVSTGAESGDAVAAASPVSSVSTSDSGPSDSIGATSDGGAADVASASNASVAGASAASPAVSVSNVTVPAQTPSNSDAPAAATDTVPVVSVANTVLSSSSALVMPDSGIPVASFDAGSFDLGAFAGDLENQLGQLEQVLTSEVFTQALPLLGTAMNDAYTQGVAALHTIASLQTAITTALNNLLNSGPATAQMVQDAINGALHSLGFNEGATVSYDSGSGTLTFGLNVQGAESVPIPLAQDFGIPNLKLTSVGTNTVNLGLNYGLDFNATLNAQDGFAVTEPGGPALQLGVNVTVPDFNETADLGILQVTATNPRDDTFLNGNFSIDTSGDATFSGAAQLDTHVVTNTPGGVVPTVSADLEAGWSFGASNVGTDVTVFGSVPSVAVNNITFDLGPLVDNFLRPILDTLAPVLKPLQDVLALFNYDLTPIFQAALGDGWHALDVAGNIGPGGTDAPDDKITLLDLLRISTGFQTGGLITLLESVNSLLSFASFLDTAINTATTPFSLGSYSLTQDIRSTSFDISQAIPSNTQAGQNLSTALAGLSGGNGTQNLGSVVSSLVNGPNFSMPILDDGIKAFQFLFGGAQDIFDANLPIPQFNFGTIDAAGAPINPQDLLPPIPTAIPGIDVTLSGALQVIAGLNIGFDTSGLEQYAQSDFTDPSLIQNGLFIADPVVNNVVQPILSVGAAVELGLELNAIVASIGGGGDVSGQVNISLAQPGKNYLNQLESKIGTDPLSIFSASGRITAGLDAIVKVFGQSVANFNSPRVQLYSFNIPGGSGLPSKTTWTGATNSDFETASNWSPAFGLTSTSYGSTDYYGDATIALPDPGVGKLWLASFQGPYAAELTSLTIGVRNELDLGPGILEIDGSTTDSANAGRIAIDDTANLILQANLKNSGTVALGFAPTANESPTLTVSGLVDLYGGGALSLSDAASNLIAPAGADALLLNTDNTISGDGIISAPILNEGVVTAGLSPKKNYLVLSGSITNQGTLASMDGNLDGTVSGLKIAANVDNTGGTILAGDFSTVLLENGVTITGGLIQGGVDGSEAGAVVADGAVTLDGSQSPIDIEGEVEAGVNHTMTLTGVITSTPVLQATLLNPGISTQGGTVILANATIENGFLNAYSLNYDTDSMQVSGTTTLSGRAGDNALDISGVVYVGAGNTVVMDGTVAAVHAGFGIELGGGAMVIGDSTSDAATFGTYSAGVGLTVRLDPNTGASITGADSSSVLTNFGTIDGDGSVGSGGLTLRNETGASIIADPTGTMVVDSTSVVTNAGWIGAGGGVLDLHGTVMNAGGTIGATDGTTLLDGATIQGGMLATSGGGTIHAVGSVTFDGSANEVVVAANTQLTEDAGGTITTEGNFANRGTMTILGDTPPAGPTILSISGSATTEHLDDTGTIWLDGPGAELLTNVDTVVVGGIGDIVMNQANISGRSFADPNQTDTLENLQATIEGSGTIGRDGSLNALTIINDAIITANDPAAPLTLNGNIANHAKLSSANGGRLILTGTVDNSTLFLIGGAATIEAGAASTVELSQVTVTGGDITADPTGTIEVAANSTLDGTNALFQSSSGVTLSGNAVVDAGTALTLKGDITNNGTLLIAGNGGSDITATVVVSGSVTVDGGGTIQLTDISDTGSSTTQVITGTASTDLLDNVDNTIIGAGLLGAGLLTLDNETAGVIEAQAGTLSVDTGSNQIVNAGLLGALAGGTLILQSNVNDVNGTIAAAGGNVNLAGVTVTGGVFAASPGGAIHADGNSTLDGSGSPVTLAAGAPMTVDSGATLTLKGTFIDQGTLNVDGNGEPANDPELFIDGLVTLGGTGTVSLAYLPGGGQIIPEFIEGGTLDHVSGTISGSGGILVTSLINEAGAVIDADNNAYGSMDVAAFTPIQNRGVMEGTNSDGMSIDTPLVNSGLIQGQDGGVSLSSQVTNTGTILAGPGGYIGVSGTVNNSGLIEAGTGNAVIFLTGLITGAASDTQILGGGRIEFLNGGTMAGGSLTNAAYGVVLFDSSAKAHVLSNIAVSNAGLINVFGDGQNAAVTPTATLEVDGTVTLSGTGSVVLADLGGTNDPSGQVITATPGGGTLDNIGNTIRGYGELGAGDLTLINEAAGTIEATGGTMILNTGATPAMNKGLIEALGGTLTVQTVLNGVGGGTVAALNNKGTSGVILLDGGVLQGGTVVTDVTDPNSVVEVTANSGTLDGNLGTLTLAAGARVLVNATQTLTLTGAIANIGSILVAGNPYSGSAVLRIAGTAALTGGGLVSLSDASGLSYPTTQIITGAASTSTLDNLTQTISGYGELGAGTLTLANGPHGTIEAIGGTLTVDTGLNTITNQGLMEAVDGLLIERGVIDGTGGGTVAALNNGAGSGIVLLDGATLHGGTIVTDLTDRASIVEVSVNGGTLDGTAGAVTIVNGAQVVVGASLTLVAEGTIANSGTILVAGNPYSGDATVRVSGTASLTGGGLVSLVDVSGLNYSTTQVIVGTASSSSLDNVDNLIRGYGSLGAGTLTLSNEAAGIIEAIVGTLTVDTGANSVTNKGLLEAIGGELLLNSNVANSGTISAGAAGDVVIGATVANTRLVTALNGGTVTVRGGISGASSTIQVAAGGTMLVDGGSVSGGSVTNAATGNIDVTTNGGTLANLAIVNAGTLGVLGNPYIGGAVATIGGTVTLTGGGLVSLRDTTGLNYSTTQIVTGTSAAAKLINVDNTISGYGSLGAGTLTLLNEAKGTIEAILSTLVVDTGASVITNQGLMEAFGADLTLRGVIDNTAGGTIAALANGGTSGVVLLDGATLRGGSIVTDQTNPASVVTLTTNGGTLDGTAGAVNLTTGAHLVIGGDQTLTAVGTIAGQGTISVAGNPYLSTAAELRLAGGTVTLSDGALLSMFDLTGNDYTATQIVTGVHASDTLDNLRGTISGYGSLGAGSLTLINEAPSTIEATGGLLTIDTGSVATVNKGLIEAVGGTLALRTVVDSTAGGTIMAVSNGGTAGIVLLDGGTLRGGSIATDLNDSLSRVELTANGGTLDGTAAAVTIDPGAHILIGSLQTLTAEGAIADRGTISLGGNAYNGPSAMLRLNGGTLTLGEGALLALSDVSGNDYATTQIVTAANASDTLDNAQGTISGYGSLGAGSLTLINETPGLIEAAGGLLTIDTGAVAMINDGLAEAIGGTLDLKTNVTNSGVVSAGAGGGVVVELTVAGSGVIAAATGGTVTVRGAIEGAQDTVTVGGGGLLVLDGGTIAGGTLGIATTGSAQVTLSGGTLQDVAVINAGTIGVLGNAYVATPAVLKIGGTVTLAGGGAVSLLDVSGNFYPTQIITGISAAATLDNADNTISGYGSLGAGTLTLINEAKATIEALSATLTVDTGLNAATNLGLMEALGGTLLINSGVTNSGTMLAGAAGDVVLQAAVANSGVIAAASGGTLTARSSIEGATGSVTVADAALLILTGGTLAGGSLAISATGTAEAIGTGGELADVGVTNAGEFELSGNAYVAAPAVLTIGGTVTLSGGGAMTLFDGSGNGYATTQVITGTAASATLDNVDNTISGYGSLGLGSLSVINEAAGTIEATGGTLTVDTGAVALINRGALRAISSNGVLDLRSNVNNAGGTIAANGGVVELDGVTIAGGVLSASAGGSLAIVNSATLDGTANQVLLAASALLDVTSTETLTLDGAVRNLGALIDDGALSNTGSLINDGAMTSTGVFDDSGTFVNDTTFSGDVTITAAGDVANPAGATVTGALLATAAGQTILNLGTVDGLVSLAGGDRLVTGAGAVFSGGISGGTGGNTLEIASGPYALTDFDAPGTPQYTTLEIDPGVSVNADLSDNLGAVSLINYGTLDITSFEASLPVHNSGEIVGDVVLLSGVPLINSFGATISGDGLAVIEGMNGPAYVVNDGVIDPASYGVLLPAGGTVTNGPAGVIEGTIAGVSISGGAGTVTNGGTIIGDGTAAVILAPGFANLVVIDPGAVFTGTVDGGNQPGGAAGSTLEFAAGGQTTLSGLGSQFVGFTTVAIDPGALASLGGANVLAAGDTLNDRGALLLDGGATLTEADTAALSGVLGSTSAVTVDGVGSSWNATNGILIGGTAAASVTITNLGSLGAGTPSANAAMSLGVSTGGAGSLTVRGGSAALYGQLDVGQGGTGNLTVAQQGSVVIRGLAGTGPASGIDLGQSAGGSGNATVTGAQSLLDNAGMFVVGDAGLGELLISAGGSVVTTPGAGTAGLVIANTASAAGSSVNLTGANSTLRDYGALTVGYAGFGQLAISQGAAVFANSVEEAGSGGGGAVSVTGAGSALYTGMLTVGFQGSGSLNIVNGASVSATGLTIGFAVGSSGNVVIGPGSHLTLSGTTINVGYAGSAVLDIQGGTLGLASGTTLAPGTFGRIVQVGGLIDPASVFDASGGSFGGGGTAEASGTILNSSLASVSGGAETLLAPLITSSDPANIPGDWSIKNSGTLVLDVNTIDNSQTIQFGDLTGVLTIGQQVTLDATQTPQTIAASALSGFAAPIVGFKTGDKITFSGLSYDSDTVSGNVVTLWSGPAGTGTNLGSLTFQTGKGAADKTGAAAAGAQIATQVSCFAAGTRIATVTGPRAVETLREGDELLLADGGRQPIVWIGQRAVNCRAHPNPEAVCPVRVSAGAFGENVPLRDLYLSPDHAVLVNNVLVPVKLLANGTTIVQVERQQVTYFHVELPEHAVILAEGLTVESYLDTGDRANFHGGGGTIRMFPDFAARLEPEIAWTWETRAIAKLVLAGAELAAARGTVASASSPPTSGRRADEARGTCRGGTRVRRNA